MNSASRELPVIYLKAGELHITEQPASVLTVLGSCLAVTMLHRPTGINAICHGLLPECREMTGCSADCSSADKYVVCAIRRMTKEFNRRGVASREIEVKVFGGAEMFSPGAGAKSTITVGKQNTEAALRAIAKEGLTIASMDVGGVQGRKLFFNTATGEVLLKRLQPNVIIAKKKADPQ